MTNAQPTQFFDDFKTAALSVRHWSATLSDRTRKRNLIDALLPILTPDVLQHLPPPLHVAQTHGAISAWIDARADESDVYLIETLQDKTLIGLLILVKVAQPQNTPNIHIGYLFSQTVWGNGYASQMLAGVIAEARNHAPLTLSGGVARENPASAHILRKLGFSLQSDIATDEVEVFTVTID